MSAGERRMIDARECVEVHVPGVQEDAVRAHRRV
jgi:hypothetical protein